MGRGRGRVLDKFPQQVHNGITPAEAVAVADSSIAGAFTEVEWSVPVTLSLRGSTLLEANKITADLVFDRALHAYAQHATAITTVAGMGTMRCWVMNEKRTAAPTLEDNAVMAYFEWQYYYRPMQIIASAGTFTVPELHGSGPHKEIELEDAKTGQGALVAQPTIYIYAQGNVSSGVTVIEETAWTIRLSLHYRNVETPSGEEFVTELMAKFT